MKTERILYWAPRVLGILFAIFISLFALDVFGEGHTPKETAIALLMHLIPTALIVLTLVLAWKWEWIGLIVFLGLAIFYIAWAWGKFPISAYIAISGPLALIGLLFGSHMIINRHKVL
ncbi:MAG: hypothetical protein H6566_12535 [Lewinellaceae bacterium]|nr:hypothetical protein [Lewinellaceae bacterium]